MSIEVMSRVWKTTLPAPQKFVLVALADWSTDDGKNIYPSIQTISRKTSYSVRTIQRILRGLQGQQIIGIERFPDEKRVTNTWMINLNHPIFTPGDNMTPPGDNMTPPGVRMTPPGVRMTPPRCQDDIPPGVRMTPDPLVLSPLYSLVDSGGPQQQIKVIGVKIRNPKRDRGAQ